MDGLIRIVVLSAISIGISSGSADAVDFQVAGGLVTSGSAEISSSSNSNFGYKVSGYNGSQIGVTGIFENKSYLMLNQRQISGTADFLGGQMERKDISLTYSPGFMLGGAGYFGWKSGNSKVTSGGIDYFNFDHSGPFIGGTLMHKFSDHIVAGANVSLQFITSGSFRPSYQPDKDKAEMSQGYGFGLGLAYLVNSHFSLGADYKYSYNNYNFKTECYSCTVNSIRYVYYSDTYSLSEKLSNVELTAKYRF